MKRISVIALSTFFTAFLTTGCDKSKEYPVITPVAQAHFSNLSAGTYSIKNEASSVYKIPVGVTTVSDKARTVSVSVVSPTGATVGTQYNLSGTTLNFAAGKVSDTIIVNGIYAGYTTTRVDTLTFTIIGGADFVPSDYNKTFKLVLKAAQ